MKLLRDLFKARIINWDNTLNNHWQNAKVTPPPRLFSDLKVENVQGRNKLLPSSIFATATGGDPDTGSLDMREYEVHINKP